MLDENPRFVKVANGRIVMDPGGKAADDNPDVVLRTPEDPHAVSSALDVRVANIHGFHTAASTKGAEFLTPPIDRRAEPRCRTRDPDGHLIEAGRATCLLKSSPARTGTGTGT